MSVGFFFKQKTAYEMRISDWSSDVCSSDLENIRSGTNIYTPLVELVVNAIQAIEEKSADKGLVEIEVLRNGEPDIIDRLEGVDGFIVKDNGMGFTDNNRNAFDTL